MSRQTLHLWQKYNLTVVTGPTMEVYFETALDAYDYCMTEGLPFTMTRNVFDSLSWIHGLELDSSFVAD